MTVFVVTTTSCTIVILPGGVGMWITRGPGFGNLVFNKSDLLKKLTLLFLFI